MGVRRGDDQLAGPGGRAERDRVRDQAAEAETEQIGLGNAADKPTLVRLATEAGLPAAPVQAVLGGDAYADAVRADEQQATRYGITGVPFFVADGKYAVSGAQPPEVLLQLLQRAYDETSQLTPVADTTGSNSEASCDGDSCTAG